MAAFGLVLMLLGFVFGVPLMWTIGSVLLLVGVILWILGANGHEIGGRRHYF